jgi:hypothetical protein
MIREISRRCPWKSPGNSCVYCAEYLSKSIIEIGAIAIHLYNEIRNQITIKLIKMKKIIYSIAIVLALVIDHSSYGQLTASSPAVPDVSNDAPYSKKSVSATKAARRLEFSNAKAAKNFKRKFDTDAQVQWFRANNLILATYKENDITTRITYNNNGSWMRTMNSYDASLLPKHIARRVNKTYKGYTITWVDEVRQSIFHCYFISIRKGKEYKQLTAYDGTLNVYKEFIMQ